MERPCGWNIAQVPLMSGLGTIRYRKPSAEADWMGKRYTVVRVRWARSVIVNTQRRPIEWAHGVERVHWSAIGKRRCVQAVPQSLFMYMGIFAIAASHSEPSGATWSTWSLSAHSASESASALAQASKFHVLCLHCFWKLRMASLDRKCGRLRLSVGSSAWPTQY